jgi:hypothetical protein
MGPRTSSGKSAESFRQRQVILNQGDQKVGKITQILEKVAKTLAKPEKAREAQFKSSKHLCQIKPLLNP